MLQGKAQVQRGFPFIPGDASKLASCSEAAAILPTWQSRDPRPAAIIEAWHEKRPQGSVVVDSTDGSCLVEGPGALDKTSQGLTLVTDTDPDVCDVRPAWQHIEAEEFPVQGSMAELSPTREYHIVWPPEGTCTPSTPCPVMFYFHGCGHEEHYLNYAKHDEHCFKDLKAVLVFPKSWNNETFVEKWTLGGTKLLDTYIVPLWDKIRHKYAGLLDEERVAVAGSSMGSGMALQCAIQRPDIFSAALVAGLTDGAGCDTMYFDNTNPFPSPARTLPSPLRLKTVVVTLGELEDKLPFHDPWRLNATLDLLDTVGMSKQVALHLRLYEGMDHLNMINAVWRNWAGLHQFLWHGEWRSS